MKDVELIYIYICLYKSAPGSNSSLSQFFGKVGEVHEGLLIFFIIRKWGGGFKHKQKKHGDVFPKKAGL